MKLARGNEIHIALHIVSYPQSITCHLSVVVRIAFEVVMIRSLDRGLVVSDADGERACPGELSLVSEQRRS